MAQSPPKPGRRNRRLTVLWLLLLSLFIAELLVYTWARVQCTRTGYEISSLTKEQQRLNELQTNLKVELARLKAPQRITKIAQEKLGLTLPTPRQVMVMP